MSLTLELPEEVANEVHGEGLARLPLRDRADTSLITAAVDIVGIASDMVTMVVAAPALTDVARRFVRWARKLPESRRVGKLTVQVTASDGSSVRIELTDLEDGQAVELVAKALRATAVAPETAN
jgi:hypothetical protein